MAARRQRRLAAIGISLLSGRGHSPQRIRLSWGSAVASRDAEIHTAAVTW